MSSRKREIWLLALSLYLWLGGMLWGEEAKGHQRLGVEVQSRHQLMPSLELSFQPGDSGVEESYIFTVTPGLWYMFKERFFAEISLPLSLGFYAADEQGRAQYASLGLGLPSPHQSPAAAVGDLSLGLGLRYRIEASRLSFGLRSVLPTGNSSNTRLPLNSSGLLYLGGFLNFSQILDPVVWTLSFNYQLGLPGKVQGVKLLQPGLFQLDLRLSEYLNDIVSYQLRLSNRFQLPELREGRLNPWLNLYTLSAYGTLQFRIRDLGLEATLGLQLYPSVGLPNLSFHISYLWKTKEV